VPCRAALALRAQREAHTRPKHNILDSEIAIGSFLWPNGLRRRKIKPCVSQSGVSCFIGRLKATWPLDPPIEKENAIEERKKTPKDDPYLMWNSKVVLRVTGSGLPIDSEHSREKTSISLVWRQALAEKPEDLNESNFWLKKCERKSFAYAKNTNNEIRKIGRKLYFPTKAILVCKVNNVVMSREVMGKRSPGATRFKLLTPT